MEKGPSKTITKFSLSDLPESWIKWLREEILDSSVGADQSKAFLCYLADLGIFTIEDSGLWTWRGVKNIGQKDLQFTSEAQKKLKLLARTESGWAIGFFLRGVPEFYQPPCLPIELKLDLFYEKERNQDNRPISSDLSNLHIVRKVGRQLSPFIEMESRYLNRLSGKYVGKTEAQKLYYYILSKTRFKGKPLPWQQLSRRRHK